MTTYSDPTGPTALTAEGTGINLQVLKGPTNYLRWSRDFQVVAQAKGLWDYFNGKAEVIEQPKPSDYGFGEKAEDTRPTPDPSEADDDEAIKAIKKDRKPKVRTSLLPADLLPSTGAEGAASTTAAPKSDNMQFRLALYKMEVEMYEKFCKYMSMAMALLVAWVDPSIRGRLQSFEDPYVAFAWLKQQYSLTPVRALEIARNTFEKLQLARCRNMQSYINDVESARLDVRQAGGTCDDDMVIDKLIRGLTADYESFVDQYHFFRDTSDATYDLPTMTHRLLTAESDMVQRKEKHKTVNAVTTVRQCDTCGKKGHTKERCWQTHPELKLSPEDLQARRNQNNGNSQTNSNPTNNRSSTGTRKILAMTTTALDRFHRTLDAKTSQAKSKPSHSQDNLTQADLSSQNEETSLRGSKTCQNSCLNDDGKGNEKSAGGVVTDCMLVSSSNIADRNKWILDSGANTHAVNHKNWFTEYHSFDLEIATAGDENTLHIQGGGIVELTTTSPEGDDIIIRLSKVAYTPELRCNILSLSQLTRYGNVSGLLTEGAVEIVTSEGETVTRAIETDGLYVLNCKGPNRSIAKNIPSHVLYPQARNRKRTMPAGVAPPMVVAAIDFQDPVWKWHRRLGHLGFENIRRLLKVSEGMNLTDKQIKGKLGAICPVCATTRAIVRIPRDPATRRFQKPGELIHIDSWGPYPVVGIRKIRHFVAVTDDATRYTWTEEYQERKDLKETLLTLLLQIQRSNKVKIRNIRTDNEFVHDEIKAWCEARGIHIEFSAPYMPSQNGVAERQFRTERERAAAMLQEHILPQRVAQIIQGRADEMLRESTAPEKLWPEARVAKESSADTSAEKP